MNIRLDEETHAYYAEDGRRILGVSEILKMADVIPYRGYAPIDAAFGRSVHRVLELYDMGMIDGWPDGLIADHLAAYKKFREDSRVEIVATERIVYHPVLDYCGKPDRVVVLNGRVRILDIKTGSGETYYWYKAAAYAMAYEVEMGLRPGTVGLGLLYLRGSRYSLFTERNRREIVTLKTEWLGILKRATS